MADQVKCRYPACEDDTDCMNGCKPAPQSNDPAQCDAATQPFAYFYERATARTNSGKPALWQNELTFGKPDTHEFIRNVTPLYAAVRTPAGCISEATPNAATVAALKEAEISFALERIANKDIEIARLTRERDQALSQVEEASGLINDLLGLELGSSERAMAWLAGRSDTSTVSPSDGGSNG